MENELQFPPDMTVEEGAFIQLVKNRMLQKLNDRQKFIFVYRFELGHNQRTIAEVLNVHETNISRQIRMIREALGEFRGVKNRA